MRTFIRFGSDKGTQIRCDCREGKRWRYLESNTQNRALRLLSYKCKLYVAGVQFSSIRTIAHSRLRGSNIPIEVEIKLGTPLPEKPTVRRIILQNTR